MGSCGSVKKHNTNGSINGGKKNSVNSNIPNGLPKYGEGPGKRKSIKLQEFDRISNATIMDGILFIFYLFV